jgi:hypothetical protein
MRQAEVCVLPQAETMHVRVALDSYWLKYHALARRSSTREIFEKRRVAQGRDLSIEKRGRRPTRSDEISTP